MDTKHSNSKDIEDKIKSIIEFIGDNPDREGLRETPKRMIKSWREIFDGYTKNPKNVLKSFTDGACDEMVVLKNIDFYSTCEHHFLPFYGKVSIGYVPNRKVIGISKLARVVEIYSRRLQIQERMTTEIADLLVNELHPLGVIVLCKAQHLCMISRGVKKQNSLMITSAIRGIFRNDEKTRMEFLNIIKE